MSVAATVFSCCSGNDRNEVIMHRKSVRLILAGLLLAAPPISSFAFVSVGVSITVAPPALPVYVQPPCPAVGYIWTPGYWAFGDDGYYWVPGTWVMAPTPGLLWTPGYWGWSEGVYLWHAGYWGPHVGFYGGVNYGFGYGGVGFEGGYWRGGAFFYNRAVANLGGIHVTNVYNKVVVNNVTVNRVSFNGGPGGIQARATGRELAAEHEHHVEFTAAQRQQEHLASTNRELRAAVNGGSPRIAATARPGVFTGSGVVRASAAGGPVHAAEHGGPAGTAEHGGPAGAAGHGGLAGSAQHGGAAGSAQHGGPGGSAGHGGEQLNAHRNDRPPGASGSLAHGAPAANPGHVETNHFAENRSVPQGAHAGPATAHVTPERSFNQPRQLTQSREFNAQPREFNAPRGPVGGQPHPQNAPRPQGAPENRRGPEPRAQPLGEPRGAQHEQQNHSRR
jgi:WXXGXW repeat (2 copies)